MRRSIAAVVLVVGALSASAQSNEPAVPSPQDRVAQARAAAATAEERYNQKDFVTAAEKFKEAYALEPDPNYLFNIAQAYRHAGDCASSADYYGRFLVAVPEPEHAAAIRAWHSSQVTCAHRRTQEEPPRETPQPVNVAIPVPRRRNVGITLTVLGAGVALGAAGGYFGWRARDIARDRDELLAGCTVANPCAGGLTESYDRRGRRANLFALIGLGAGGAAVAASAAIFLLSGHESAAPVTLAPVTGGAVVSRTLVW
jgi:hypothetical protein